MKVINGSKRVVRYLDHLPIERVQASEICHGDTIVIDNETVTVSIKRIFDSCRSDNHKHIEGHVSEYFERVLFPMWISVRHINIDKVGNFIKEKVDINHPDLKWVTQ